MDIHGQATNSPTTQFSGNNTKRGSAPGRGQMSQAKSFGRDVTSSFTPTNVSANTKAEKPFRHQSSLPAKLLPERKPYTGSNPGKSDFRTQVNQAYDNLKQLNWNENDPFTACRSVCSEYKRLLGHCQQVPSYESEYLRNSFRKFYVHYLGCILDLFDEETKAQRGREMIPDLLKVLSQVAILRFEGRASHGLMSKVVAVLHRYVREELSYLRFRCGFGDRRGELRVISKLRTLLNENGTCQKKQLFSHDKAKEYTEALDKLEKKLDCEKRACHRTVFAKAIAEGKILEAGLWVTHNDNAVLEARMVRDIMRCELDDLATALDRNNLTSLVEKVHLLQTLTEYSRHYFDLIGVIPEIAEGLIKLCSAMTKQTFLFMKQQSESKVLPVQQAAKKALDDIEWLKKTKVLDNDCMAFLCVAEEGSDDLSVTIDGEKLDYKLIDRKITEVMSCFPKPPAPRDIEKGMQLMLPLLQHKQTILAQPWAGGGMTKRFKTLESIVYTEYFQEILHQYTFLSKRYSRDYERTCQEMACFREQCLRNKDFTMVLKGDGHIKDDHINNWNLTVCKVWGYRLGQLQNTQEIRTDDLNYIDELLEQVPNVPCTQTRNRLWSLIARYGQIAVKASHINESHKPRLQRLLEYCDLIESDSKHIKTHEANRIKEIRTIRAQLKKAGTLISIEDKPVSSAIAGPDLKTKENTRSSSNDFKKSESTVQIGTQTAPLNESETKPVKKPDILHSAGSVPKQPAINTDPVQKRTQQVGSRPPLLENPPVYIPPYAAQQVPHKQPLLATPPSYPPSNMGAPFQSVQTVPYMPVVHYAPLQTQVVCQPQAIQLENVHWCQPIQYVGVRYDPAAIFSDPVRLGFGYLEQAVCEYQQNFGTRNFDAHKTQQLIQLGIGIIYHALASACSSEQLKQDLYGAMRCFLMPNENGIIASVAQRLKLQLVEQSEILMYFQLIQIINDLYCLRYRVGLPVDVPMFLAPQ